MFTGIIQGSGKVKRLTMKGADAVLEIETGIDLNDVSVGDSIAVSGACLTVTAKTQSAFSADVSAETLTKTTLKLLKAGDKVNLEKSLKVGGFVGKRAELLGGLILIGIGVRILLTHLLG